jgi:Na+-driven multidrug efflux pump
MSPTLRRTVLTIHISSAVALLGTTAGLAVMAGRAGGSDDFAGAHAVYEVMRLLTLSLGIPLSFVALVSGATLALTGRWGLFGYWWVTAKLGLLVAVIVVGATATGASIDALVDVTEARPAAASDARWTLIVAVAAQSAMVLAATVLSVVRPGGRMRRPARVRDART